MSSDITNAALIETIKSQDQKLSLLTDAIQTIRDSAENYAMQSYDDGWSGLRKIQSFCEDTLEKIR